MPDDAVVTEPTAGASVLDSETVAAGLGVDPATGLSDEQAARRLQADGPNELRGKPAIPIWRKMLAQFQDSLIYLLLAAVAISLVAWVVEGAEGAPVDAIVIGAIVLLNAILGYAQEAKAEDAVAALGTMTAAASTVWRGGELKTVPSSELVRGDVLVLGEGDTVGADARLLSASALRIQEASLTGESEAVTKNPATLTAPASLGDRVNMVYKGTSVAQGAGRAIITGVGMSTEVGAIAEMLDATVGEPTPLQNEVNRIGRMLGIIVLALTLVVMITIILVQGVTTPSDLVVVLLLGVSLAVAAVPEGLPTILSVVLAIGVQRMARRNAVVKKLSSVEALGSASVICTDKTGTLTRNEMTIERVVTASGRAKVTGVGYRPTGSVQSSGEDLVRDQRLCRPDRFSVRPNRRSHALNLSDDSTLVASTGLAVLTPTVAGFAYLYEVTRLPEFTAYLENVAEGSAYPAVRVDRFKSAPIPAVDDDQRLRFESVATPMREHVHTLSEENRTLAATRDALLPQLMSGKLRVKDAESLVADAV